MELTSSAFKSNTTVPRKFTCDGDDFSPPLAWTGAPAQTKSFVLIMDDPDAPAGTWVHWVIYDIPGALKGLEENLPKKESLKNGARQGLCWGVTKTDFDRLGYYGPCPPPGKPHHYSFRLYALKEKPTVGDRATKEELTKAMEGKILAQAELIGVYER